VSEITTVGLDLAKNVFQSDGADACCQAVLCRKLRRGQLLELLAVLPRCTVEMEACGGAHFAAAAMVCWPRGTWASAFLIQ
jgi:transposase